MLPVLLSAFICGLFASASAANYNYTLLAHLSRQSATLAHGLELANRLGNIGGGYRYGGYRHMVAFAAYSSSDSSYSSSSYPVKFPNIVTNVGNAFSSTTGKFKAPFDGVYVFEWSIRNYYSGGGIYPGIFVNGNLKMHTYCYSYSSYHSTCSKTVPLELNRGDQVSIRRASGTLYVDGTYSSFSGWLL